MIPRIGLRFLHRRVVDSNGKPATYVVTAIRQGVVWYKQPDERKAKECCLYGSWASICLEPLL